MLKSPEISTFPPSFSTEKEKTSLLALILTKQCFKVNRQEILNKCNLILKNFGKKFEIINNLYDVNCLLLLLNVLTDGEVEINKESANFGQILSESFQKAHVPLVINESSLDVSNQFTFLIQIEIIFEHFSEKINQLIESEGNVDKKIESEEQNKLDKLEGNVDKKIESEEQNELDKLDENVDKKIESEEQNKLDKHDGITEVEYFSDSSDSDSLIEVRKDSSISLLDKFSEDALLKTINGICENNSKNILEYLQFANLQLFFANLFSSIPRNFKQLLYNNQIDEIIKVLSKNDPIFSIKLFNFKDQKYKSSSAITFFRLLLNNYFLKQSRDKLFERCSTIVLSLTKLGDFFHEKCNQLIQRKMDPFKERSILFDWETYLALVYFLSSKSTHFNIINAQFYKFDYNCNQLFKKTNIPKIIDEEYIISCNFHEQDAMFYQLQFIFDAIDQDFSCKFVELFSTVIKKLRFINVPDYKVLAANIRAKNVSLIVQMKKFEKISKNKKNESQQTSYCKVEDLNILRKISPTKPTNFDQRQLETLLNKIKETKKTKFKKSAFISFERTRNFLESN